MRTHRRPVTPTDAAPGFARVLLVACLVAACLVIAAGPAGGADARTAAPCPGAGTLVAPPVAGPGTPAGATTVTETLVDRTRGTEAAGGSPALDCRVLPVEVHVPAPDPAAPAPHPLLLVVHGRDGNPARLRLLFDAWVAAGYVVAAPTFPITRKDTDDKPLGEDVGEQAHDVSFVLNQLLAQDRDPSSPLAGVVDPSRIGAAGMSLGGMTVYGLVSNRCCRDTRIDAAVEMAGVYRDFPGGRWVRHHVPMLLLQGDQDNGYHNSVKAYAALAAPKWFITLHGSSHSPPFEDPRDGQAKLVDAATTRFWDRYLRGQADAAPAIAAAVRAAGDDATLVRQVPRAAN
jgi:dienelactone hydrolase